MKFTLERLPSLRNGYYIVKPPPGYPGKSSYPSEHRVIYWLHHGELPSDGWHIHHINGDRLDNRIENLEAIHASDHVKMEGHIADKEPESYETLVCHQCKTEYQSLERRVRAAKVLNQENFFCSKSCQTTYQNQFKKGKKNNYPENRKSSGKKGVMLTCQACDKEYYVRPYKEFISKTCSKPCSYVYKSITRTGIKVPERVNKLQYIKLECAQCHKEFERNTIEIRKSIKAGATNCFCTSACIVNFNNAARTARINS